MMTETSKGTALITGGGQGIGRGIALELARRGFDIAINDIVNEPDNTAKGAYEVLDRIQEFGVSGLFVQGDISKTNDRKRLLDETLETFGQVDLLVNNAGIAPPKRMDILETTEQSYDLVMNVNLRGPFFLTQLVANQMIKQIQEGTQVQPMIVFITSISAYVSSPSRPEYCISKAGLSMVNTLFAHRLADEGIGVYEIRPGIIETDMTAAVKEKYDKLIEEGLLPQSRWGQPVDVGKVVGAIADGDLAYSTGQVIEVGGGFHIQRL
ncbi:MAG: 3-ketoacyl-ACP reductase [bacterium]